MVSKIRPNNNQRSADLPVDDQAEAVIVTPYYLNSSGQYEAATTPSSAYSTRIDEASSTITYVGEAAPGTSESNSLWRIKRLDSTSGLKILWADGDANFDNRWDQRASASYV